jgi:hypothetical protein
VKVEPVGFRVPRLPADTPYACTLPSDFPHDPPTSHLPCPFRPDSSRRRFVVSLETYIPSLATDLR